MKIMHHIIYMTYYDIHCPSIYIFAIKKYDYDSNYYNHNNSHEKN